MKNDLEKNGLIGTEIKNLRQEFKNLKDETIFGLIIIVASISGLLILGSLMVL